MSCLARSLLTLGLLLVPLAAAVAETTPEAEDLITLRASAVVEDDVVRLGDIFEGIGDPGLAGTPIARAPEPGATVEGNAAKDRT
jgi:hypothetical protein